MTSPASTTSTPPTPTPVGDFPAVTALVDAAIAEHRMPGAVVQIGHDGKVLLRRAFGDRKLDGEPGLDGIPSPAEPMTVDTIFDMASLTKVLGTTTAVLQLHEHGRVGLDEPVQRYLPGFNTTGDPLRAQTTLRMLLTHTSGIGGDLSHEGPWGLTAPDKADGLRRALTTPLVPDRIGVFHYSDINFIIVGDLVETLTGRPLDEYVQDNVFGPLGMTDTRFLPVAKACGPHRIVGTAIAWDPGVAGVGTCPADSWNTSLLARIAPTAHDDDTPGINPDFGRLIRGTVHDPTARRIGGTAGSAGVFTTVADLGRFAQALLDRRAGRPSAFPLGQSTVELMTTPQQPGHHDGQVGSAGAAERAAIAASPNPLLAPRLPAIPGQSLRGLGWDIDTALSGPRGAVFPVGGFGHTGFTGVSVWLDPGSDTYVVVLANVIHQPGGPPITRLAGEVATVSARTLGLYGG